MLIMLRPSEMTLDLVPDLVHSRCLPLPLKWPRARCSLIGRRPVTPVSHCISPFPPHHLLVAMSLSTSLRGVQGVIGRHALLSQQQSVPAMSYMRQTFALVQQRQQRQQIVRMATTSAKVATTHMTPDEALKMLNEQRSIRPNSPHLTIYEPQLTWIGSIANRITGVGLSACKFESVGRGIERGSVLTPFSAHCFSALRLGNSLPGSALHTHR